MISSIQEIKQQNPWDNTDLNAGLKNDRKYFYFNLPKQVISLLCIWYEQIEWYAYLFLTGLSSRNLNITVAFSTAANRTRQSSLYEKILFSIDIAIFGSRHYSILYITASNSSIPVEILIKYCPKNIWSPRQGYGV